MSADPNIHRDLARIRKAAELAQFLLLTEIEPKDLAYFDDACWEMAAQGAGVNPPSEVTRRMVEALLAVATKQAA